MESPPAPPLPPPPSFSAAPVLGPKPPSVAPNGPPGAFLVELLVYNGSPFKDHWAYFVRSNTRSSLGVKIHATGDVRNGFIFEVKRMRDLDDTEDQPTARIPLQWVDAEHFNENAMFNNGISTINTVPVCGFEVSAHKVQAPGKSLNAINDPATHGRKVVQRDCQTWIVESADQLVLDGVFHADIATYLYSIKH